jgi:transcriptional regulator with XRE-family HTH domain
MDKTRHAPEGVGARLKEARELHGLTQAELARETGLNAMNVWRHEAGLTMPSKMALARYTERLRVTEEWLVYGSGRPPTDNTAQIVDKYLETDAGRTTSLEVRAMLYEVPYKALGVAKLTAKVVHATRLLIESNRRSGRNKPNGGKGP